MKVGPIKGARLQWHTHSQPLSLSLSFWDSSLWPGVSEGALFLDKARLCRALELTDELGSERSKQSDLGGRRPVGP